MNTTTMRTMIAAAALVVAAGSASAQTFRAEIPMAFRVSNKTMAPGSYDFRVTKGAVGQMLVISNRETNSSAALVTAVRADPPKAWRAAGAAMIAFSCTAGTCSLRKLWDGSDASTFEFPAPKAASRDLASARTEIVTLSMIKAH